MEHFDGVIVGAGPAGSTAARFAAKNGLKTLFVDHRKEIGVPVQCGELLPECSEITAIFKTVTNLNEFYNVPAEYKELNCKEIVCVSPDGYEISLNFNFFTVNRVRFDKYLANLAVKEGAELRTETHCWKVKNGTLKLNDEYVSAKVIIGADGPFSQVARDMNMTLPRELYPAITSSIKGNFPPKAYMYFGSIAPFGYAWIIPQKKRANVGLGVKYIPKGKTLKGMLFEFIRSKNLDLPDKTTSWVVPMGPPAETLVKNNVLLAGDAGNHVMAVNGGGIPTGIIAGRDAGIAASLIIQKKKPVTVYDSLWKMHIYEPLKRAWIMKRRADFFFRGDKRLNFAMKIVGSKRLGRIIRCKYPFIGR